MNRPSRWVYRVGEEKHACRNEKPGYMRQFREMLYGSERIGTGRDKRTAVFFLQRFREDKEAIAEVQQGQRRSSKERRAWIEFTQDTPHDRAKDETKAESGTDHAKGFAAIFRFSDIGNVSIGRGISCAGNSRQGAPEEKQPDRICKTHNQEIDRERCDRGEEYGPASKPIRQCPKHRSEQKVHEGICRAQPAYIERGAFG